MIDSAARVEPLSAERDRRARRGSLVRIAWRNLWRSPRRTFLTAVGIAGAIFLVTALVSIQLGAYDQMIDVGTRLMSGHVQVQHPEYAEEARFEHSLADGPGIIERVSRVDGVLAVAPRTEAFALVSAGERSFGGLVVGVEPAVEKRFAELPRRLSAGEYLPTRESAFVGESLARNLGLGVGDEIVALGATPEGGVAAGLYIVHGLFSTGVAELDRSLMQVPIAAMQSDFELGDRVHRVVMTLESAGALDAIQPALEAVLDPTVERLVPWHEVLPEIEQTIEIDWVGAQAMFGLLMAVVLLFVVNAIVIIIFERTQEFGMLLAIGMRPSGIMRMLVLEAIFVWMLGAATGVVLAVAVIIPLTSVGITIPVEELADRFFMPSTLLPKFSMDLMVLPALVMLVGTVIAALLPALRIRHLKPVEALRDRE